MQYFEERNASINTALLIIMNNSDNAFVMRIKHIYPEKRGLFGVLVTILKGIIP